MVINTVMLPYHYNLQKRIISDDLATKLVGLYNDNTELFEPYISPKNIPDGNTYFANDMLRSFDEVIKLRESCVLQNRVVLLMHKPNTQVIRHKDVPLFRQSVIMTPLLPGINFPPTNFYVNDVKVTEIDFSTRNSVLFNTQQFHDLTNGDSVRLSFQILFSESFEQVHDLLLNNKLFK